MKRFWKDGELREHPCGLYVLHEDVQAEIESLRQTIATLNESLRITSEGNFKLRQQLSECERERDEHLRSWNRVVEERIAVTKERDELKQWLEDQVCEAKDFAYKLEGKTLQLATVAAERDELKANSDRYELLREMKLYEMMEYRCLPVPIEEADDWFDAQTDAKIRERYPRATIGADKMGEVG